MIAGSKARKSRSLHRLPGPTKSGNPVPGSTTAGGAKNTSGNSGGPAVTMVNGGNLELSVKEQNNRGLLIGPGSNRPGVANSLLNQSLGALNRQAELSDQGSARAASMDSIANAYDKWVEVFPTKNITFFKCSYIVKELDFPLILVGNKRNHIYGNRKF